MSRTRMSLPMHRAPWLGLLWLAACAHPALSPSFKPPPRPSPERVLDELSKVEPRQERAVVVAITQDPPQLAAWSLDGKPLWQRPVAALSAPVIAGDTVVLQEKRGVVVRALADGRPRVTLDEGAALIGADGEGDRVIVALSYPEPERGMRSILAMVDGDRVRWTRALPLPAGIPALAGQRVVVPWATHRLSVLSTQDGEEAARLYFIGSVLGQARIEHDSVWVGQLGLLHVDSGLLALHHGEVKLTAPLPRTLPGQPPPLRDGYAPAPEPGHASHRVALDWRVGREGKTALHDSAYLRFYRVLFALAADADELRWVRTYEQDVVGADVGEQGLLIVDAAGSLRWLDAQGNERVLAELSQRLQVAALRAGAFAPPAPADATAATPVAATLREQLFAAASLPDTRVTAARSYAVERLATLEEARVTEHLVALCNDSQSPEGVRRTACAKLPERANGGSAVLSALAARKDHDERERARMSVGPLALAAAKMGLTTAGPVLLALFEDLRTPAADLAPLATALGELAYKPAAGALARFLRIHHAEPEGSDLAEALKASAQALLATRGRDARNALTAVAESAHAEDALRTHAQQLVATLDAPPARKPTRAEAKARRRAKRTGGDAREGKDETEAASAARKAPPQPRALDPKIVQRVLQPVQAKLERCVAGEPTGAKSSRVAIVVDGKGQPEGIFVTPTSLQACMEPLLRGLHFPQTQLGRQQVTHVIHRRDGSDAKTRDAAPDKPKAKTKRSRSKGKARGKAGELARARK